MQSIVIAAFVWASLSSMVFAQAASEMSTSIELANMEQLSPELQQELRHALREADSQVEQAWRQYHQDRLQQRARLEKTLEEVSVKARLPALRWPDAGSDIFFHFLMTFPLCLLPLASVGILILLLNQLQVTLHRAAVHWGLSPAIESTVRWTPRAAFIFIVGASLYQAVGSERSIAAGVDAELSKIQPLMLDGSRAEDAEPTGDRHAIESELLHQQRLAQQLKTLALAGDDAQRSKQRFDAMVQRHAIGWALSATLFCLLLLGKLHLRKLVPGKSDCSVCGAEESVGADDTPLTHQPQRARAGWDDRVTQSSATANAKSFNAPVAEPRERCVQCGWPTLPYQVARCAVWGRPTAGKSTMLAALLSSVQQGRTPDQLGILSIDHGGPAGRWENRIETYRSNQVPPRDQDTARLLEPFVLDVRHGSWLRRLDYHLAVSDTAGELLTMVKGATDPQRRRCIQQTFMVVVVDPVGEKMGERPMLRTEPTQDLHPLFSDEKRIADEGLFDSHPPVAFVLSKLDLLFAATEDHPQQRQFVEYFYRRLEEIDAKYDYYYCRRRAISPCDDYYVSLALMEERSSATLEFVEHLWPQWSAARQLRKIFADRFLWFPISSIGLKHEELNLPGLQHRSLDPYGLGEPFVWGLHRTGFEHLSH